MLWDICEGQVIVFKEMKTTSFVAQQIDTEKVFRKKQFTESFDDLRSPRSMKINQKEIHMKRIHSSLIAVVVCTLALATFSGKSYAAAANKELTAPITTEMTKSNTKAPKQIPHEVNINTADKELLTQLPGIGPVTADMILKYRSTNGQFSNIDDLTQIKGIGTKTLEKLRPYLYKI